MAALGVLHNSIRDGPQLHRVVHPPHRRLRYEIGYARPRGLPDLSERHGYRRDLVGIHLYHRRCYHILRADPGHRPVEPEVIEEDRNFPRFLLWNHVSIPRCITSTAILRYSSRSFSADIDPQCNRSISSSSELQMEVYFRILSGHASRCNALRVSSSPPNLLCAQPV